MAAAKANPRATMVDVDLGLRFRNPLRRLQDSPVEYTVVDLPADRRGDERIGRHLGIELINHCKLLLCKGLG